MEIKRFHEYAEKHRFELQDADESTVAQLEPGEDGDNEFSAFNIFYTDEELEQLRSFIDQYLLWKKYRYVGTVHEGDGFRVVSKDQGSAPSAEDATGVPF